jgi:hypothetical protein
MHHTSKRKNGGIVYIMDVVEIQQLQEIQENEPLVESTDSSQELN